VGDPEERREDVQDVLPDGRRDPDSEGGRGESPSSRRASSSTRRQTLLARKQGHLKMKNNQPS